jgi:hypothetical protein
MHDDRESKDLIIYIYINILALQNDDALCGTVIQMLAQIV